MKASLIGATLLILVAGALPASAQQHYGPYHSAIAERQQALTRLIDRGVRSGSISRGEARRLYAEQHAIRNKERRYRADGILTRAERLDLMRDLTQAERRIYNAMRDTRRHYVYRPY